MMPEALDHEPLGDRETKTLSWLSAPDPSTNHNAAKGLRQAGTGSWFLESEKYATWKARSKAFLWLHGVAGCGKTVLSSSIVQTLQETSGDTVHAILYFYFDFNDTEKQSFEKMIRSLVSQLYRRQRQTRKHLDDLWVANLKGCVQPNTKGLEWVFRRMMDEVQDTTIVLDAFDECRSGSELLTWLKKLADPTRENVHAILTSRKKPDIEESLNEWINTEDILSVQNGLVDEDIRAYVRKRVQEDDGLQRWRSRPEVQQEIETELMKKADGMFRWAACQLDALDSCMKLSDLRSALASLPTTLDETYSRILRKIPEEYLPDSKRILQFLAYSQRPLRLEEAIDPIAVQLEEKPRFETENRMPCPQEIVKYCPGLVSVIAKEEKMENVNNSTVLVLQLAHFSVKEHLTSDRIDVNSVPWMAECSAKATIARVSVAYLCHVDKGLSAKEIRMEYPFAQYAAENWMDHAAILEKNDETLRNLVIELFLRRRSAYLNWLKLFNPDQPWTDGFENDPGITPLYWASLRGLTQTAKALIARHANVNARGGKYGTALQAASRRGHQQVVQLLLEEMQLLLEEGGHVNALGGDIYLYGNALEAASRGGHEQVARLLLEYGADVNAELGRNGNILNATSWGGHEQVVQGSETHGNPLYAASERGHERVVQLLLEKGADFSTQGNRNALQAASRGGHEQVVRPLLEKIGDVHAQGDYYNNALQAASGGGHEQVVRLMLEKGADVNVQSDWYGSTCSAFQAASERGHEQIVRLLLETGADVNAQGGYYNNALQAASYGGHAQVVRLLLENGADANAQGSETHGNALYAASDGGHAQVVRLLLENGADANAQGSETHGNALYAASDGGHERVVRLLLEKGADVNARGGYYNNALQAASYGGHEQVVRLLLEKGADANAQSGGHYGSALQASSAEGHEQVARLLLEKGADVNARGGIYGNALHAASEGGHDQVVRLLLEKGADVNAQGGEYGKALHAALNRSHDQVFRLLLDKRAEVKALGGIYSDHHFNAALTGSHIQIVRLLREKGAEVNLQDGEFSNALRASREYGHDQVVRLLLEKIANVNAHSGGPDGNALYAASAGGHKQVVRLLLEKGADVNAQGVLFGSALYAASAGGHEQVIRLLLEKGADVNAQGDFFGNSLQAASWGGHQQVVRLLLEYGADVNARGGIYVNALHAAVAGKHEQVFLLLLGNGGDIHALDREHRDALEAASASGSDEIAQLLHREAALKHNAERMMEVNVQVDW